MYLFKSLFDLVPFVNLSVPFSGSLGTSWTGDGVFLRSEKKQKRRHNQECMKGKTVNFCHPLMKVPITQIQT